LHGLAFSAAVIAADAGPVNSRRPDIFGAIQAISPDLLLFLGALRRATRTAAKPQLRS